MFNFCSLYSGSTGNCLLVQTDETKILIDAGVSQKKIMTALASFNVNIEDIDAILVTHEHSDHVQNVGSLSKRYNIPVYCNIETLNAMPVQKEKISDENRIIFTPNKKFKINDIEIQSFQIPHDAANPCGFNIIKDNSHQLSIATDIGHMTNDIVKHLEGSELLLLESNYDTEVLKCCKYPFHLKARIAGSTGHLSNTMSGKTISYLLKNSNLNTAILGHLSKESNFPELAYQTVVDELLANNCNTDSINLSVASRELPGRLIKL
mgnify:CR=1 FL=1